MAIKSIQWTGNNKELIDNFLHSMDCFCFYVDNRVYVSITGDSEVHILKPTDWLCVDSCFNLLKMSDAEYVKKNG